MTNEELLIECKKGLNMPVESNNFDGALTQKILAVKAFISNAGVNDTYLASDLAVGLIVIGVTDLWNITGGDIKFSPVFFTILTQLVLKSGSDTNV